MNVTNEKLQLEIYPSYKGAKLKKKKNILWETNRKNDGLRAETEQP